MQSKKVREVIYKGRVPQVLLVKECDQDSNLVDQSRGMGGHGVRGVLWYF